MAVSIQDITDRRRAEEELRQTELKYRTIADSTYDWVTWEDPDGRVLYVSPSCERITGYRPEEFEDDAGLLRSMVVPDDLERWDDHRQQARGQEGGGTIQFRIRRRDGDVAWVEHVCQQVVDEDGRRLGTRASNRDITLRKEAERGLAASEAFLRTVLSSMRDHVAVIDRRGMILSVNSAWLRFARENGLSDPGSVLPGADYLAACRQAAEEGSDEARAALDGIRSVLEGESQRFDMEYNGSSPDTERWFGMTVVPLLRETGGAVITHTDVTRQRAAEERAREREQSLAEAQRIAHLGSWRWDIVTDELAWSDEVFRIFGLEPQQFAATYEAFLERVHPEDREAVREAVEGSLADPDTRYSIQHRVTRLDGGERVVHERGEVTFDASGRPVLMVGTVHDITEQAEIRELRAELAHVERLSTVGAMTAALAHEINQPLSAIRANAQAALRFLDAGELEADESREIFDDIIDDSRRAGEVIRRLRALLRKEEAEREPLCVNDSVQTVLGLLHSEIVIRNIAVELDLADGLPPVVADRVQIQQVILNLMSNGADAMEGVPWDARKLIVRTCLDGTGCVRVSVADTGPGIEAPDLDRVFEPFFTTKAQGLGVGLPICRTIIEAHGGRLWAEADPERGAAFTFSLPCVPEGTP
jgi:PAS domain S-box-containing protein